MVAPLRRVVPLAIALLAGCRSTEPLTPERCWHVLDEQAAQWNRGDLRAFVDTYWPGSSVTFLGSRGLTEGQEDLLANYERGYPTAEARGVLTFHRLGYRALGPDHVLLLGRYELQRSEPDAGYFSLVLQRHGDGVKIVHDHTSRAEPDDRAPRR